MNEYERIRRALCLHISLESAPLEKVNVSLLKSCENAATEALFMSVEALVQYFSALITKLEAAKKVLYLRRPFYGL